MNKKNIKLISVLALVSLLSACASTVKQNYNAATNTHINTIDVVKVQPLEEVYVTVQQHAGASFGLIGGLVAAADISHRTSTFNEALAPLSPQWHDRLNNELFSAIETAGYTVNQVESKKELNIKSKKNKITKLMQSGDAILGVGYSIGYMSAGMSDAYQPVVSVHVKLVDKNEAILYSQDFAYGFPNTYGEPIHLSADTIYSYQTLDDLVANAPEAVKALELGIKNIAEQIGKDLTKAQPAPVAAALTTGQ